MNDGVGARRGRGKKSKRPHTPGSVSRAAYTGLRNRGADMRRHLDVIVPRFPGLRDPRTRAEREHDLNLPLRDYAAAIDEVARGGGTREDREIAAFLGSTLPRLTAPCGHTLRLPMTLSEPGRHVVLCWQCATCGDSSLLDVRVQRGPVYVVRPLLRGSADAVLVAWRAHHGEWRQSTSGGRYKVQADDWPGVESRANDVAS
jgi:hypothetical protein